MDVAANCTTNDISRNDEQCSVTTNVVENHPPPCALLLNMLISEPAFSKDNRKIGISL